MNHTLQARQEGRVLRLWLNRPEQRNALSAEMCQELIHTLDQAGHDQSVGSILLAGRGESFCTGVDLQELDENDIDEISSAQELLFTVNGRLTKPLIGAVHGAAVAGGTGLAANCHLVVASEDATFGLTDINLGLWPFVIFHAVSAALGERRTVALALTGEIFSAADALTTGLVHRVVPARELEQRSLEVAQAVANHSSSAIRCGLGFVHEAQGHHARLIRDQFLKSPDFQQGLRAFLSQPCAE